MNNIEHIVNAQRAYFMTGETIPVNHRIAALRRLQAAILSHKQDLLDAMQYLYINALNGQKPSAAQQEAANYLLNHLKLQQSSLTLYGKSLMAVVLAQHGDKSTAEQYLKSLEEYTVGNEEMGLYYDSRRAAYSWCNYRIPT